MMICDFFKINLSRGSQYLLSVTYRNQFMVTLQKDTVEMTLSQ